MSRKGSAKETSAAGRGSPNRKRLRSTAPATAMQLTRKSRAQAQGLRAVRGLVLNLSCFWDRSGGGALAGVWSSDMSV